jgi:hypothetical protein
LNIFYLREKNKYLASFSGYLLAIPIILDAPHQHTTGGFIVKSNKISQ